ncbi:MAG: Na+/H+ antiporter NhaA [Chitinophagaceae bacterium]|nr:MAG: Na+/H+ antiporter NhaA [Chitinophagaceae bacterium]
MPVKYIPRRIFSPLKDFLKDSRAVGIVLIACTTISLILSNTVLFQQDYTNFWVQTLSIFPASMHLPQSLLYWINDGLMTVFFFLVGMEIKRELIIGELASVQKSMLPVLAALGGMIFPAVIFFIFNGNTPFHHGWGIPMATDIAFSLGIISLLGNRVPVQLKIFLTALAIIDDLGAIIIIAVFYATNMHWGYLLFGLGLLVVPILFNLMRAKQLLFYFIPGIVIWYCFLNSGIHPTIAGVLLAFCIPLSRISSLEHTLYHVVNFIIMPLFALANTAIIFPSVFDHIIYSPVTYGIMLGLILGKPIGIILFSWLSVKLKIASLPDNTKWKQILGTGMIAGIGFTMSIFIATLAYKEEEWQVLSKIAIIAGSVIAGISGYFYLRIFSGKNENKKTGV